MAPEIQTVVCSTQAWLQTSWHVQVPYAWLEACVEWLQEEAGGPGRLSQQQINQQALDQWLLTDLRDLDCPVLPERLAEALKTKLSGTFCVQVDSFLDISQPAYGQLQKWKGTDCGNDDVSAVTQTTQRPWEARPTRMLLLQITDGVQSLEAMEYQPIPALSTALRPGAKLQLQGQMVCRLGMLLLGPSNIKVLGGEVEDLVDRNTQGRVLSRTLGLAEVEEQQQQQQEEEEEEGPPAPQQVNPGEEDLDLDDAELLASLDTQEEVQRVPVGSVGDSGYGTLGDISTSSLRSVVSTASSRSGLAHSSRGGLLQEDPDPIDLLLSDQEIQAEVQDHHMAEEDFPDEDFDDIPFDELDSVIYRQTTNVTAHSVSHRNTSKSNTRTSGNPGSFDGATKAQTSQFERHESNFSGLRSGSCNSRSITPNRDLLGSAKGANGQLAATTSTPSFTPTALEPSHEPQLISDEETDFMDEDMDCFLEEVENFGVHPGAQGPRRDIADATKAESSGPSYAPDSSRSVRDGVSIRTGHTTPHEQTSNSADHNKLPAKKDTQSDRTAPVLTLTSPPFTYLCLLEDLKSKPHPRTTEIRVKAFIVTLLGKLISRNNAWSVCATISDGTSYMDVELSDKVLTDLLGFSVAEKASLKRNPARRGELDAGMRRCQEGLVDMCCLMTIVVEPDGGKAVVTKADQVTEKVLQELEMRARARRR
ncbi:recQ-mediated genome instability protein 1 isoform X2 [Solea solea]|uniref:recQ-mediated genome instability protein 1 isoform X2 n=1 Tax=Solea solea TaxID=90069 RepID=UPI00272DAE62|nr:recQ-mediated genome instability protein 1 isoform X2 [Solea solea]